MHSPQLEITDKFERLAFLKSKYTSDQNQFQPKTQKASSRIEKRDKKDNTYLLNVSSN
jgi:hypothetical protein